MFEKSLGTLIKGLRSQRGKDEAKYVAGVLDEIRTEIKSADMEVKGEAVLKLAYLQMLGYQVKSVSFHILEAMASQNYRIKHIGYLAAALCFADDTEVLILATNLIKKDLHSAAPLDVLVALNGLSHVINQELAQHLGDDIAKMLTHSRPAVRKRAVLVLYSAILRYPELLDRTWERLRDLLCDPDQSVVTATMNAVCELARRNPAPFVALSPQLFDILTNSSNNWLLIKVIKLFSVLAPVEPRLIRKLQRPLTDIISTTPAMSLLYECIHTAITANMLDGEQGEQLAQRCIANLGEFLEDRDQNLRYIALLALAKLVPSHPDLVAGYQDTILASIRHPDMTIRLRALDLVCQLVHRDSMRHIVEALLDAVAQDDAANARSASTALQTVFGTHAAVDANPQGMPALDAVAVAKFHAQVAENVLELGSAHDYVNVPDMSWYFDILLRMLDMVDAVHAVRVADQLIEVVARTPKLRPAACAHLEEALGAQPHHQLLRAGAWVCSEYPLYTEKPQHLAQILVQDVCDLPLSVMDTAIQGAMKLFAYWTASLSDAWDADALAQVHDETASLIARLRALSQHASPQIDQCVQESLQLLLLLQTDLTTYEKQMPRHMLTPPRRIAAGEEQDAWAEEAAAKTPVESPRALHLLLPLYFTREDEPLQVVPLEAALDVHAWVVPQSTWAAVLDVVEPAQAKAKAKAQAQKEGACATDSINLDAVHAPQHSTYSHASTRDRAAAHRDDPFYLAAKPKKSGRKKHAAQNTDDLDEIPIVQLSMADFIPATPASSSPDTQVAIAASLQPKVVTRKKRPTRSGP
ncbi:AP-3 complex subunit delta [Malassezia vespertilionis]|uniref:AP-3 complex subunit delta n=1 Tax=Malassezia vespertilionis TaxID=2020962 RepID=UPI0024B0EEB6|nr:AP-3 complex subunit delta [Malassezia vespertilionis]WFD05619.1 AP-3 complex subunit delta [Malassezia vespertilionis]